MIDIILRHIICSLAVAQHHQKKVCACHKRISEYVKILHSHKSIQCKIMHSLMKLVKDRQNEMTIDGLRDYYFVDLPCIYLF